MKTPSKEIIDKTIDGLATPEEASHVARWFSTDEGQTYLSQMMNQDFFLNEENLFNEDSIDHEVPSDEIYAEIRKQNSRRQLKRFLSYAAAVILPLILVLSAFIQINTRVDLFGQSEYKTIKVPKGDRIQMMFQDGTVAYLNSNTTLKYPTKFGLLERKVELEGEAYFVVEKNAKRPFIVMLDSASVQVYGTSFNVEAYSNEKNINVTLDEGIVKLVSKSGDKEYGLEPGERLVYDKFNHSCVISMTNEYNYDSIWKTGGVALKNKSVEEVIKLLTNKFDIEFVIEDKEALKYSYTIIISENASINKVISDLEKIAPVRYSYENNQMKVWLKK